MILSIETATELCGAALVHNGECIAQRTVTEKNIHSERLLVLIDEVLRQAHIGIKALDGIAVSIGPGSFTGLRIGLSAAKGLAYAQSLPLVAVPTLDSIAEEALRLNAAEEGAMICALIDAKRDEAYYAFYAQEKAAREGSDRSGLRCLSVHAIASIAAIADEASRFMTTARGGRDAASGRIVFVGDGAKKIAPIAAAAPGLSVNFDIVCSPSTVGMIAERRFAVLKAASYAELEPVYIREFVTTMPRVANQTAIP